MSERQEPQTLRLTDEGLETPGHLVGETGQIEVQKPEIKMTFTYTGDGVSEFSELVNFPPTEKDPVYCPEGHVRIRGTLYEIVDDRDLNECPHCGSDKVSAADDPARCYTCETDIRGVEA
jgi:hypothetical protein